ncbi:MAG: peptide-methionine (S)-S-oxide reductase MsrA [Candidatus Thermoplasmatota archaeon]
MERFNGEEDDNVFQREKMTKKDNFTVSLLTLLGIFGMRESEDELIKGEKPPIDKNRPGELKTATFSMGCFWGPDSLFGAKSGVINTKVGYAGGTKEKPTYHRLGDHTETVQVRYDPDQVSYNELIDTFWRGHNPTQSKSTQYMSIIFFHNEEQEKIAKETKKKRQDETSGIIRTEIRPFSGFHLAEDYHQKYHLSNHKKFYKAYKQIYPEIDGFIDSTAVTRANGYISGNGSVESKDDLEELGLSQKGIEMLFDKWKSAGGEGACSLE